MQQDVQTDAMCNIHIQQCSDRVVGQHMLHPFAGGFTVIDSLIFAFIASGIFQNKKKKRKESYIILLV